MKINKKDSFIEPDEALRVLFLQSALDLVDQGISLVDEQLRLVAWNDAFLKLLDFPLEMAHIGADFKSFIRFNAQRGEFGPGQADELVDAWIGNIAHLASRDIEHVRPNGRILSIKGFKVPQYGYITLYSDITEQKLREKEILNRNAELEARAEAKAQELLMAHQRNEARIRLITDSIPALVAYFGNDRQYHYVNRGYQDWFGVDPANPSTINARKFLGTATYERIRPYIMQALQGQAVTFEYELMTLHQGERIARTSLIPEVGEGGSFLGCFELTFDITDERLAQSRLLRAQKMEALGQLTGGLAHDFNNILTVIQGNLLNLADQPDLLRYEEEYVRPAVEAVQRGADLIRGLLNFSRKQPLKSDIEDLKRCIRSTAQWMRSALPDSLVIEVEYPESPLYINIDANQFRDALLNIALNARDATDGKGTLSIRCTSSRIDSEGAKSLRVKEGLYAVISLEDDGCGMDAETLSRVFEPFFTTKNATRGTGLGMSMVYGFIQQSEGAIDLRSTPGVGTTVTMMFPLIDHKPSALHPPEPIPKLELPRRTDRLGLALLIEDDASIRQWLRRELVNFGYAVIEAENGEEGIMLLENMKNIQLILSDVVMPGNYDGIDVINKSRQRHPGTRTILMSGYVPKANIPADVPLLQKPFTREELFKLLEKTA